MFVFKGLMCFRDGVGGVNVAFGRVCKGLRGRGMPTIYIKYPNLRDSFANRMLTMVNKG